MTRIPSLHRQLTKITADLASGLDYADELLAGRYEPSSADDPDELSPEEWSREVQKQLANVADQLYGLAAEASATAKRLAERKG